MIVIPAVDIKGGRCVRLFQGVEDAETVFSHDPSLMALQWEEKGAQLLHVIDLDGAFSSAPKNINVIQRIIERVKIPIQLGGGIRDMETLRMYLNMGVERIILGTTAIRNSDFIYEAASLFPGRIIVGIDARGSQVAVEGWKETTDVSSRELALRFDGCGLAAIIFTDINRDGTQTGPNLVATKELASAIATPLIASGGVSSIDDIKNILSLEPCGIVGVIVGKALYSGTVDLREAMKLYRSENSS
ncbi:MAG: 1-(5-phosphoribosyl)-5-[(5-phosphoribosylamino)methylideneamino]imidazole-4-carboxamide isomerase [Pseudomonadota bacterium]